MTRTRIPLLCAVASAAVWLVLGPLAGAGAPARAATHAPRITPPVYAEIASGVARIKTRGCRGDAGQGTGFLVGQRVLMTARHVIAGSCSIRVILGNRQYAAERIVHWYSDDDTVDAADLTTLKLDRPARGHVFEFARRSPRPRTTVAIVGHPLGNPLSLHQGRMLTTTRANGVPTILVWMAAAQGASGSPFLDPQGSVVGILQRGFVRENAGVVSGINLVRWWGPGIVRDLCRAYPQGGIRGCSGSTGADCRSQDSRYLDALSGPYGTYVTRWNAWVDAGEPYDERFRPTLDALNNLWLRNPDQLACSRGAKTVAALIEGLQPTVDLMQETLEQMAAYPQGEPAHTELQARFRAQISALDQRLERLQAELERLGFFSR